MSTKRERPRRQGERGATGARGTRGARGERGQRGERGEPGPAVTRAQILVAVHGELEGIRKELRIQLERMSQIQQQLDGIQTLLTKTLEKS